MKTQRTALAALLALLLCACGDDEPLVEPEEKGPVVVSMPGFSFSPFSVSIGTGESVIFDFPSIPHNVIFDGRVGAPADIQETSNVRIERVFSSAGRFPYDCTLHPGMSGEVVVTAR